MATVKKSGNGFFKKGGEKNLSNCNCDFLTGLV